MARPRKSLRELELSGAFKKNPKRLLERVEIPEPTEGIGDPPEILKAAEKAVWRYVVSICAPGVLTNCDSILLLYLSRAWAQYLKHGEHKGGKHPGVSKATMQHVMNICEKFGLSPPGRQKIHVPKKSGSRYDNEFAEFDSNPYAEFDPDPYGSKKKTN